MMMYPDRTKSETRGKSEAGRILDMTPDGGFRDPHPAPLADRLFRGALIVAVIGAMLGIAALALWFALLLIPVILAAGLLAYGLFRWRLWRAGIRFSRPDQHRPFGR
jgi:hypothetical protein